MTGRPGRAGASSPPCCRNCAPSPARYGPPAPAGRSVAILYSQASFRLRWLLDRSAGARWWERDAERGNDDNAWRAARRQLADRLDQLGIAPRWLSTQGLEAGVPAGVRVVILPHVLSLSDTELAALRAFAGRGGRVLADTEPGLFDGHGRRRAAFPLEGVATTPQPLRPDPEPTTAATLGNFAVLLGPGPIALLAPDGQPATGVDTQLFDAAGATLLSMQTMAPYAGPPRVTIVLPQPASITDLRTGRALGRTARLDLALDPIEPTVLRLEP